MEIFALALGLLLVVTLVAVEAVEEAAVLKVNNPLLRPHRDITLLRSSTLRDSPRNRSPNSKDNNSRCNPLNSSKLDHSSRFRLLLHKLKLMRGLQLLWLNYRVCEISWTTRRLEALEVRQRGTVGLLRTKW